MYKYKNFKESRFIDDKTVACPVVGCDEKVPRAKDDGKGKNEKFPHPNFLCPKHGIYVSPSTFVYEKEDDNLLWYDDTDQKLLESIKDAKRESRMASENSEDAVTWNVFRYLEKNDLLKQFLERVIKDHCDSANLMYWSYSDNDKGTWTLLKKARDEFREVEGHYTEPDIIIDTPQTLFFIEAKLTSGNRTPPSDKSKLKQYVERGEGWFEKVFAPGKTIEDIAVVEKKYQLLRLWLLGSWIAKEEGKKFCLVNLVLSKKERDIENVFGEQHLRKDEKRCFLRITWENIYEMIRNQSKNSETDTILEYFRTKSAGYNTKTGKRNRKMFSLPDEN